MNKVEKAAIDFDNLARAIKLWGRELGFADLAVAGAFGGRRPAGLREWLQAGYHGEMDYMAKRIFENAPAPQN